MTRHPEIHQHPKTDNEATEEKREEQFGVVEAENRTASQAVVIEPEDDDDDTKPTLPFSKARCIALVATVTGASFLNVSTSCSIIASFQPTLTDPI